MEVVAAFYLHKLQYTIRIHVCRGGGGVSSFSRVIPSTLGAIFDARVVKAVGLCESEG